MYPDIVRIAADELIRHEAIAPLMDTIHSFGASLLVKDIQTSGQLAAAIRAGANYLQGNLFSEPVHTVRIIELLPVSETAR